MVHRYQSKQTGLKTVLENNKCFNIGALCAFSPLPDLFGITLIEVKYEFNIAMLDISPPLHPQAVTGLLAFLSLHCTVLE